MTETVAIPVYHPVHHRDPEPRMYVPGRMLVDLWATGRTASNAHGGCWRYDVPDPLTDTRPFTLLAGVPRAMAGELIRYHPGRYEDIPVRHYRVTGAWLAIKDPAGNWLPPERWRWMIAWPD